MRFAFVMPYFFKDGISGGAEKQSFLLSKHLVKEGFDVHYITSKIGKGETYEGIKLHRILDFPHIFQYLEYPKIILKLFEIQPDVVLTRIRHYYLPVSLYSILSGKISILFVPEDAVLDPLYETLKTFRLLRAKNSPIYKYIAIINSFLLDIFSVAGILTSHKIVVQNENQREKLMRIYGRTGIKVPSIIEIEDREAKKTERLTVCWIGNIREGKRVEIFIEIAKRLPSYEFYMIGRIPDRYRWIKELNISNLKVLGELSYDETQEYLSKCWVYINTSEREREGFPNTFLESWVNRTLVITFGVDPDGIVISSLGVKVNDVEDAIRVIKDFAENRGKYQDIIDRAYEYVIKNHSPESILTDIKNHLSEW